MVQMKRLSRYVHEAPYYRWEEHRYRQYLLFGEMRHHWILWSHAVPGWSAKVSTIDNDSYQRLQISQKTAPCKLGSTAISFKEDHTMRTQNIFWFRDRFYEILDDFKDSEIEALIERWHANQQAEATSRAERHSQDIERLRQQPKRKA